MSKIILSGEPFTYKMLIDESGASEPTVKSYVAANIEEGLCKLINRSGDNGSKVFIASSDEKESFDEHLRQWWREEGLTEFSDTLVGYLYSGAPHVLATPQRGRVRRLRPDELDQWKAQVSTVDQLPEREDRGALQSPAGRVAQKLYATRQ